MNNIRRRLAQVIARNLAEELPLKGVEARTLGYKIEEWLGPMPDRDVLRIAGDAREREEGD